MTDAVRERYDRFARNEAPGRSDVYEAWATGVAHDAEIQAILAEIPDTRRQPPLVFAVTRMLGAGLTDYVGWRQFVIDHASEIVRECAQRRVQTNEPLRLAALLPVLSEISGPVALLEIGASAGLCLYPDRYSYRYIASDGLLRAHLDPETGRSPVVLESVVDGVLPPLRLPEIVWRAGIDLDPVDARNAKDRAWLTGLVWPGEAGREARIDAALDIAAAEPPVLVAGDASEHLAALAASAPEDATLVVTTPGVLAHIPWAPRHALIEQIRALNARWITIDAPDLHDAWQPPIDANAWEGFVVALDGKVRAAADPLGRWWEWRAGIDEDPS